jgi:hypothetical protein
MPTIFVKADLPINNGMFTQDNVNAIRAAMNSYLRRFADYQTSSTFSLTHEVTKSEITVTTDPKDANIESKVWGYLYKTIIAVTINPFNGDKGMLRATVLLPSEWSEIKITTFYDRFNQCVANAYSDLEIDAIVLKQVSEIKGNVVIPDVLYLLPHAAEEMERIIQRIGYMVYKELQNE